MEENLEEEEERCNVADDRVKTLEEKFIQLGNNLRSMERYEIKSNERGTEIQQKIEELEAKCAEAKEKAEKYEAKSKEMEEELESLEQQCHDEKERYFSCKNDLERILEEIQGI